MSAGSLRHLLTEAKEGGWRPDPGVEDDYTTPAEMWFTNPAGSSLLVTDSDVADLLDYALRESTTVLRHAAELGLAFMNDPEGLASARDEWRATIRLALWPD